MAQIKLNKLNALGEFKIQDASYSDFFHNIRIVKIAPNDPADLFYVALRRPEWFKKHFIPEFEVHRKKYGAQIFIALRYPYTIGNEFDSISFISPSHVENAHSIPKGESGITIAGHIVYMERPPVLHFGKKIPIFGWVDADSTEILALLLTIVRDLAAVHGYDSIRGPINVPKTLGGTGYQLNGFDLESAFSLPYNSPELADYFDKYIKSAGQDEINVMSDYNHYTHNLVKYDNLEEPGVDFIHPEFTELLKNKPLLGKIKKLIEETFYELLPDTSEFGLKLPTVRKIFSQVEDSSQYYEFAIERETGDLVGILFSYPNLFELWKKQEEEGYHDIGQLESAVWDTIIVHRRYRGTQFSVKFYLYLQSRMMDAGFTDIINGYLWTENKRSIKKQGNHARFRNSCRALTLSCNPRR